MWSAAVFDPALPLRSQRGTGIGAVIGGVAPAVDHATLRAAARAASSAFNAQETSVARASIVRDAVGSEATRPNTPGSARNIAMSASMKAPG
jgi:hypothetical protein